jgi:hypothetical protein
MEQEWEQVKQRAALRPIGNDVNAMTTDSLKSRWCAGAGELFRNLSGGQKTFHLEIEAELINRGVWPKLKEDSTSPTGYRAYDANE